jgi:RNA-directed DNA polymerase
MPPEQGEAPPALLHEGRRINNAQDAARLVGVSPPLLIYHLYKAPDHARYTAFEIPKRSGGMRQIHAPLGVTRDVQTKLAAIFQGIYEAHPSAHGFIKARSILTNARGHVGQRLVLNIDLEDFFPSINFGRVRGLLMAPPFGLGPGAATILAQACCYRNGLPQGAPTSPVLSNFIAASLDRRLTRLAKENNVRYSRYADDITFSTNQNAFPVGLAQFEQGETGAVRPRPGDALERAIEASGFAINHKKVRLQTRHQRQGVTGLNVNSIANVERKRVRRIRAMVRAWRKFGLDRAARAHFMEHRGVRHEPNDAPRAFRNIVYGELSFLKMVRGADNPIFLNFTRKLYDLDPNPSKFVRQMVFGADDFDIFISHASEDKEAVARPIFEACRALGLKAFMDEAHIGWGQNFATKINTALGAARTVLAIVSSNSVAKEWPVQEVNAALALENSGQKKVVPLIVGKPDLSRLPLIAAKDCLAWNGDAKAVAKRLQAAAKGDAPRRPAGAPAARAAGPAPLAAGPWGARNPPPPAPKKRGFWASLFGARRPRP